MKKWWETFQIISFLFLCSMLIITGCGQFTNNSTNSNLPEAEWETGHGELNHIKGTDSNVNGQYFIPPDNLLLFNENLIEKTEYANPTGKWFMSNDGGIFGYGLTSGTKQAGDDYYVSLIGHKKDGEQLNRDVRIQLTERDHQLNVKEVIEEEIIYVDVITDEEKIFSNKLPNKENVIYLLSTEILDDHNNVEDTIVRMIYVPTPEINAELKTDKNIYQLLDKTATLTLENFGPTFLSLGTSYTIEKKVEKTWRIVPLKRSFEEIGIMLGPDNKYEQTVEIDQLTPGKYRIVKQFYADGIDLSATLATEFIIE